MDRASQGAELLENFLTTPHKCEGSALLDIKINHFLYRKELFAISLKVLLSFCTLWFRSFIRKYFPFNFPENFLFHGNFTDSKENEKGNKMFREKSRKFSVRNYGAASFSIYFSF